MTPHSEPAPFGTTAHTFMPTLLVGTTSYARKVLRPCSVGHLLPLTREIDLDHAMARPIDRHRFRLVLSRSTRKAYPRTVIVAVEPP
jgi:hypothetical protein